MTDPEGRWRQLAFLATAELLGMSVWFAASAVKPALTASFDLSVAQGGWLTSGVQLGFVAGTLIAALLNLADVIPSRRFFVVSAVLAALANAAMLVATSFGLLLFTRIATGVALAGVYPPAMKMAATWFVRGRGLAIGMIVGALTAGKAIPYLLEGIGEIPLRGAVLLPSAGALLAAMIMAAGYRDGPHKFQSQRFSWGLVGTVMREPNVRRATLGYLGHMWELYAFWAWIPGFLAAAAAQREHPGSIGIWPFLIVAIGALGAVAGGLAADRVGRVRVVRWSLLVSGACCLASPWLFGAPAAVLYLVMLIWGAAVVADSAQFSALVTEYAPRHAVGTALTLQTSLGFLLSIVTIQALPVLAERVGWQWAMIVLVLGPIAGLAGVRRLRPPVRAATA